MDWPVPATRAVHALSTKLAPALVAVVTEPVGADVGAGPSSFTVTVQVIISFTKFVGVSQVIIVLVGRRWMVSSKSLSLVA